jgi:Uma2 family endonuclease
MNANVSSIQVSSLPSDPMRSLGINAAALPTMYDLPSENIEESGLPDEYHDFQPELLRRTFSPPNFSKDLVFSGSDINLYYDANYPNRYKRPDWFGVVNVPRFYGGSDLRLSYVIWQEMVKPTIVVELISLSTEKEDLGKTERAETPTKWEVYERILQIPYYAVFSRYTNKLRCFQLQFGQYQEVAIQDATLWIPELELGLGLWEGEYERKNRLWLRWYDANGDMILTDAESAQLRNERLAAKLLEMGIDPDTI